jgi:hypothetical protein
MNTVDSGTSTPSSPEWLARFHAAIVKAVKKENAYNPDLVVVMMHHCLSVCRMESRVIGRGLFNHATRQKVVLGLDLDNGVVIDFKGRVGWDEIQQKTWEEFVHARNTSHPSFEPLNPVGSDSYHWKSLPGKKIRPRVDDKLADPRLGSMMEHCGEIIAELQQMRLSHDTPSSSGIRQSPRL